VIAYRIGSRRHTIFDGAGAAEYGARWNSAGHSVIYAASSLSLAVLEQLAHTETGRLPQDHAFIEITVPDSVSIETLALANVAGWNIDDLATSRAYGDRWLAEQRTCILRVPSVIVPTEYNVLINTSHADFNRLVASPPRSLSWDRRLTAFVSKGAH
jgi:RES domain-containing protein